MLKEKRENQMIEGNKSIKGPGEKRSRERNVQIAQ